MEQSSSNEARVMKHPTLTALAPRESAIYQRRAVNASFSLPTLVALSKRPRGSDSPNYTPPPTRHDTPITLDIDNDRFNIFYALLNYPELTLEMSQHLEVDDLVNLYAISRDFHEVVNKNFTNLIYGQARQKAPNASKIFIHRCFKSLCIKDPAGRTIGYSVPEKDRPADAASRTQTGARYNDTRLVPSFRWLKMVVFRETIVDDILYSLALEGHRLPSEISAVLNKLWFTIDAADNKHRIGLIHNERFWTRNDLFVAATFFLKLDMCFTDPLYGSGFTGMRKMLLNQRTLSVLAGVLERDEVRNEYELLQMFLEHKAWPNRPLPRRPLFGVIRKKMGTRSREGWRRDGNRLVGPDELVMREAIRRGLDFPSYFAEMMLSGYINKATGQDVPTPFVHRGLQTVKEAMMDIGECEALVDSSDSDDMESHERDVDLKHGNNSQILKVPGICSAGNGGAHGEEDQREGGGEGGGGGGGGEEDYREWDDESDKDDLVG